MSRRAQSSASGVEQRAPQVGDLDPRLLEPAGRMVLAAVAAAQVGTTMSLVHTALGAIARQVGADIARVRLRQAVIAATPDCFNLLKKGDVPDPAAKPPLSTHKLQKVSPADALKCVGALGSAGSACATSLKTDIQKAASTGGDISACAFSVISGLGSSCSSLIKKEEGESTA